MENFTRHVSAFHGATRQSLPYDNLKSAVLERQATPSAFIPPLGSPLTTLGLAGSDSRK
jgi:hypothetical protein